MVDPLAFLFLLFAQGTPSEQLCSMIIERMTFVLEPLNAVRSNQAKNCSTSLMLAVLRAGGRAFKTILP